MPHPCALDETLEGCAELAAQHAAPVVETVIPSLKDALVTNIPAITERLNSAMLKVGEWVEASETFAVEQAPFLVREIVWWGVADYAYWVVFGVILMCSFPLALFYLRNDEELMDLNNKVSGALGEKGTDGSCLIAVLGIFVLPIVGFLSIIINVMHMLKPLVAPRLYLIEYFKELVK